MDEAEEAGEEERRANVIEAFGHGQGEVIETDGGKRYLRTAGGQELQEIIFDVRRFLLFGINLSTMRGKSQLCGDSRSCVHNGLILKTQDASEIRATCSTWLRARLSALLVRTQVWGGVMRMRSQRRKLAHSAHVQIRPLEAERNQASCACRRTTSPCWSSTPPRRSWGRQVWAGSGSAACRTSPIRSR